MILIALALVFLALAVRTGSLRAFVLAVALCAFALMSSAPTIANPFAAIAAALSPAR